MCDSGSIRSSNLTAPVPSLPLHSGFGQQGGKRTAAADVFDTVFRGQGVSDAVSQERIGAQPERVGNHGRRLLGVHGGRFGILTIQKDTRESHVLPRVKKKLVFIVMCLCIE